MQLGLDVHLLFQGRVLFGNYEWFGGFPKKQFKTAMKNTENLMKKALQNEV